MGSRKIIMLCGSVLIGALAGLVLLNYVQGVEDDVREETQLVDVYVLTGPVEEGTPFREISRQNLFELRQTESSLRPDTAINDPGQLAGLVALSDLAADQQLLSGQFGQPEVLASTFGDLLEPDQVGMSLLLAPENFVGAFPEPGDFVDVIVKTPLPPTAEEEVDDSPPDPDTTLYTSQARYLYRGVRIIGIDQELVGIASEPTLEEEGGSTAGVVVTFAVTSEAAQRMYSIETALMRFTLLPDGWEVKPQPNIIQPEIVDDLPTPAEREDGITPYGPDGFQEAFEEEDADSPDSEDADESGDPFAELATGGEG